MNKIFNTQTHGELFQDDEDILDFQLTSIKEPLTAALLNDCQVLIIGAPTEEFDSEVEAVLDFVRGGGGLLLVADFDTMINPVKSLNDLAKMAGLEFREYLNYPPTWLQVFSPHYVTANVERVKVDGIASIECFGDAVPIAFTKATRMPVVACSTLGEGRVIAVGDADLFAEEMIELDENKAFVTNILRWLAYENPVDIATPARCEDNEPVVIIQAPVCVRDQVDELNAAFVFPLDAEIAERLRQVDPRLSDEVIREKPLDILLPEAYVDKVYEPGVRIWLKQVLEAARREQWYNLDLLNLVLIHFAPTFVPSEGSFIPYDPALVSHLTRLHPSAQWRLEYSWLCSQESEDMNIEQNIAIWLLHQKYGHGFFYAHTRLGQQLALLMRLGQDYAEITQLVKDSAVVVNEGFAAWLELTFLGKLDREVRQAVYPRRLLLLQEATGLFKRRRDSDFFQAFPPRFDSPYREGFECLEFVSRDFGLRCALRVFMAATDIDLGILEQDEPDAAEIKRRLLEGNAQSHLRLGSICGRMYNERRELQRQVRERACDHNCNANYPLESVIDGEL